MGHKEMTDNDAQPVSVLTEQAVMTEESEQSEPRNPHQIEREVRRQLLADPRMRFESLVVRRISDGVCLQGVLETDADLSDLERAVAAVQGVNRVLNRLVCKCPSAKG